MSDTRLTRAKKSSRMSRDDGHGAFNYMNIHQGNPPKADIFERSSFSRGCRSFLPRRPSEPRCNINAWRVLSSAAPACIEIARFLVTTLKTRFFLRAAGPRRARSRRYRDSPQPTINAVTVPDSTAVTVRACCSRNVRLIEKGARCSAALNYIKQIAEPLR